MLRILSHAAEVAAAAAAASRAAVAAALDEGWACGTYFGLTEHLQRPQRQVALQDTRCMTSLLSVQKVALRKDVCDVQLMDLCLQLLTGDRGLYSGSCSYSLPAWNCTHKSCATLHTHCWESLQPVAAAAAALASGRYPACSEPTAHNPAPPLTQNMPPLLH
jgi:hypothetical protein